MPSAKPMLLAAGLVLAASVGVTVWISTTASRALRVQAQEDRPGRVEAVANRPAPGQSASPGAAAADPDRGRLLQQVDAWARKVILATSAGGVSLMLTLAFGLGWWRQGIIRRVRQSRETLESTAHQQELALAEARRELGLTVGQKQQLDVQVRQLTTQLEERIRERTVELVRERNLLARELDDRKQAEKSLTHQRQELTRSKGVLEMHVQARTQELEQLQRLYEHILNSAGEGIYGLDLQGRTTFVNPTAARLTGWTVAELVGQSEGEVFHRQATDGAPTGHTQIMDRHGNLLSEQIFYRKDGSSFPVEYVRTPIVDNHRLMGAVVLFKDITERKRAEETLARKAAELARSNAELEQFAYVASHDLQEPLRKIQAFGDRLKARLDAAHLTDGRDYLERMQRAAARMRTLIDDLLTFSRVISSNQPFAPVDLRQIATEVLGDLEARVESSKASVTVGDLPTLDADPLQMRQLLQNLISNSLKFQRPGAVPVVTVAARVRRCPFACTPQPTPDDEICELTVQDNGIGFEEQYAEKIFAVFQRLHGRSDYEGAGIGLAVCRRITDRHGGTIRATSQPGAGATFTVTLPVRQPRGDSAP